MRLLCFGDSNTYGYDPRSYLGSRYPAHIRWTDLLAQKTGWEVLNAGMNGRSIPAGEFTLPSADILVVMLGSNDLLNGCSAQETTARMEVFLRRTCPTYRHTLLVAPPPMKRGDWVSEERLITDSACLAGCYRDLAQRLGIAFTDAGAWEIDLTFDGVHFSESGHRTFAAELLEALKAFNE